MDDLSSPGRIVSISEPILAEDSTFTVLASSLRAVLEQLDENAVHHDYLVALILVLLAESGFHVSSNSSTLERDQNTRLVHIPTNWKSENVYKICFVLHNLRKFESKLIAIPTGDKLILNMFFTKTDEINRNIVYSMVVQTLKYVNPFSSRSCGLYMNLKEISQRFKDTVATPLRTELLIAVDLKSPSLQGLPIELKLKILDMLCGREIGRLSLCSRGFFDLCLEPRIWQKLLQREFNIKLNQNNFRKIYIRQVIEVNHT